MISTLIASSALKGAKNKAFQIVKSWQFWAVILVLVLVVVIYSKGKRDAQKSFDESLKPSPLPDGGQSIRTGFTDKQAEQYADNVYAVTYDFDSWENFKKNWLDPNSGTNKEVIYGQLDALTNDELVSVSNVWRYKYFKKNKETLSQAIDAEWGSSRGKAIVKRLQLLGQ